MSGMAYHNGIARYGMVCSGMVWYGMVWHGTVWYTWKLSSGN